MLITRDITERKRIEGLLKENAKKLEVLNQIILNANKATDFSSMLEEILNSTLELMELFTIKDFLLVS